MPIYIRTNGRGNAWPVPLGKNHPFYNKNNFEDLANASFSIIKTGYREQIEKELIIDAGHGAIQYLIKHENRIPEAIFLTHPHIDHTLSIDWIIQSNWRQRGTKFPVYASPMCMELTLKSFPQIAQMVDFKPLYPAKEQKISEFPGMKINFFPLFHGESALGSGMLLFKYQNKKALFTGDILVPLLRNCDYEYLQNCDVVFTDANNRYPYPNSNHWSVLRPELIGEKTSEFLSGWLKSKGNKMNWLIRPNLPAKYNKSIHGYFEQLIKEIYSKQNTGLPLSVFDFSKRINAKEIFLVHYSGVEDQKHYQKAILNTEELQNFANTNAAQINLSTKFIVPFVGNRKKWID